MNLRQDFLPASSSCTAFTGLLFSGRPTCATIHWVGPYPYQTPDIVRNWWLTGGTEGSAHFVVQDEDVLQCWPIERVCWHCGSSIGNRTSLAIEVIPKNAEGMFSDASIQSVKELLDMISPDLPICRHYDWNKKTCPLYYIDNERWDKLCKVLGHESCTHLEA